MSTWLRLTLITMSVGGGFTGIVITSQPLIMQQVKGPGLVALFTVAVLLYVFVLVAGLLFVHNAHCTMPLAISLALQVPVFYSPIITYRFGAGVVGAIGLSETGMIWWARLGADWQLSLLQRFPWGFGVNFVPLVLLAAPARSAMRRRESAW